MATGVYTDKEPDGRMAQLRRVLKSSTVLGRVRPCIPDKMIDYLRALVDPSNENSALQTLNCPYAYAKKKFNIIWHGREAFEKPGATPVSHLTSLRGALTSFWTGEKSRQIWIGTGVLFSLTAFNGMNNVWVTETFANAMDTLAAKDFAFLTGAGLLMACGQYSRAKLKSYLQRNMSFSMIEKFTEATFAEPDIIYMLTHNRDDHTALDIMPDGPHQRIGDAPMQLSSKILDIGESSLNAVMTSFFAAKALMHNSVPIPHIKTGLLAGHYGSAIVSAALLAVFLAATMPKALSMGKKLEGVWSRSMESGAKAEEFLSHIFSNGETIAASRGHERANKKFKALQNDFITVSNERARLESINYAYNTLQNFIAHDIVAFIPAVVAVGATITKDSKKLLFQTQGYVSWMLNSISDLIRLIPTCADLRATSKRITEMAQMFEKVRDKKAFYRLTGIHEYERSSLDDNSIAIHMSGLELFHRGTDISFLRTGEITIRRGEVVHIIGESGAGKSCFIKACSDMWPYGRGQFKSHANDAKLYAHQKTDLKGPYTLSDLMLFGMKLPTDYEPDALTKKRMSEALTISGLEKFSNNVDEMGIGGKRWEEILSGGQHQRFILAKILFQEPDILFLDEPTSALDTNTKIEYFKILKEFCQQHGTTVFAITHDGTSYANKEHGNFFDREIIIDNGRAYIRDVNILPPIYSQEYYGPS